MAENFASLARANTGQRQQNFTVDDTSTLVTLPTWACKVAVQFYDQNNNLATGRYSVEIGDQTDGQAMVQPFQVASSGALIEVRLADEGHDRKSAPQIVVAGTASGDTCTMQIEG